jgi:2,4-dienoyl-CoA reductase-like NADH-dependent reductase (Old Yellow Enzyme family)
MAALEAARPLEALYSPLQLRGVQLKNRITVPPMCQYSATDGIPDDYHFVHLGKFALGGFGLVTTEAAAITAQGRITHGDLGLWSDTHLEAFKRVTRFLHAHGAKASIQLAHAGRKASMQRPWRGNGPLTPSDHALGDQPWDVVGVTGKPIGPGWLTPQELSPAQIQEVVEAFAVAARRAVAAGFDVVEIHGAHGYLIHTFLSPLTNLRTDHYGGDLAGRTRFPVEVARAVRAALPASTPLMFKISSLDWESGGWTLDESVALAAMLKEAGVDIVVCSSGGLGGPATAANAARALGYQVPYAARVKREAGVMTQAVGLLIDADAAGKVIADGDADLIGIGRQALYDPFWPLHELDRHAPNAPGRHEQWPEQYSWWLSRRESLLASIRADQTS